MNAATRYTISISCTKYIVYIIQSPNRILIDFSYSLLPAQQSTKLLLDLFVKLESIIIDSSN